jgi:hypothetical protein
MLENVPAEFGIILLVLANLVDKVQAHEFMNICRRIGGNPISVNGFG